MFLSKTFLQLVMSVYPYPSGLCLDVEFPDFLGRGQYDSTVCHSPGFGSHRLLKCDTRDVSKPSTNLGLTENDRTTETCSIHWWRYNTLEETDEVSHKLHYRTQSCSLILSRVVNNLETLHSPSSSPSSALF